MSSIVLFAGTTEGRELAQAMDARGIDAVVSVATEYGEEVLPDMINARVHQGRLSEPEMEDFFREENPSLVFDATHPYAIEVSRNIHAACRKTGIRYVRVLRQEKSETAYASAVFVDTIQEACTYLNQTEGNIFLTTGSKELQQFAENLQDLTRIIARVIPSQKSIALCEEAGLKGSQIIAAQGPFSQASNELLMREHYCQYMVTKDSGVTGGFPEKMQAAVSLGVIPVVIRRPEEETGISLEEAIQMLDGDDFGQSVVHTDAAGIKAGGREPSEPALKQTSDSWDALANVNLSLIGIGAGQIENLTRRAIKAIASAQVIFGAKSVLDSVKDSIEKIRSEARAERGTEHLAASGFVHPVVPIMIAEYMPSDVQKYLLGHPNVTNAVVLFSGDSGFFSGAALYPVRDNIKRICGISSLQMLSMRTGISWSDTAIVSLHGRNADLSETVRTHRKTFVLVSDGKQMYDLIPSLLELEDKEVKSAAADNAELSGTAEENAETDEKNPVEAENDSIKVYAGYELGTDDEHVQLVNASNPNQDFAWMQKATGRFCAFLINSNANKEPALPMLSDDQMIRGRVPMTKADVRHLSVIRLQVPRGAVVWDIGAGTGSISMEVAGIDSGVRVYAIERKPEAVALIRKNIQHFNRGNVTLVEGTAPEALQGLPTPDCAFIGGTGGEMEDIFEILASFRRPVRFVLNAVSMETIGEYAKISQHFAITDEDITYVQISHARKMGRYHLMQAENGIYIISGTIGIG